MRKWQSFLKNHNRLLPFDFAQDRRRFTPRKIRILINLSLLPTADCGLPTVDCRLISYRIFIEIG